MYSRCLILLVSSLILAACGGVKTSETVFPTSVACGQGASENRFVVQWESGVYTVETARSSDEFRTGFVNKNLALIKHVDNDYIIQLTNQETLAHALDGGGVITESLNWGTQQIRARG